MKKNEQNYSTVEIVNFNSAAIFIFSGEVDGVVKYRKNNTIL